MAEDPKDRKTTYTSVDLGYRITDKDTGETIAETTFEQLPNTRQDDTVYSYTNPVTGTTNWTSDPGQATSFYLDNKTGNIKVQAPQAYLDSEQFKTKVQPTLESISQNYKLNPDYRYALMNNSDESKTSEQWVADLNKEAGDLARQGVQNENVKREIYEKDGVQLNDAQLAKMWSVAVDRTEDGQTVTVKDSDTQSLPEKIKNLAVFKDLSGYDAGSHQVTWGNLKEAWDREKHSDDDIIEVSKTIEEYFRKKDFKDADEYAEMRAMASFVGQKDPHTGFWRGAADVINNIGYGLLTGAATFWVGVWDLSETLLNAAGRFGSFDVEKGEWVEPASQITFVQDYLEPELENLKQSHKTNTQKLNDAAAATYTIVDTITPVAMQIAVGTALGKAAADGVVSVASNILSKSATVQEAAAQASYGLSASQLGAAELAEVSAGFAKSLYNGTSMILKMSDAATAVGLTSKAIKTLKAFEVSGRAIMTVADLGAQTIIDVTMTNPKLFRQFMEGNGTEEEKAYMMQQLTQNAVGWAAGLGIGRAITTFGKSDVGKVANAVVAPKVAWFKSRIGTAAEDFRVNIVHHGNAQYLKQRADRLGARAKAKPESITRANRAIKAENQAQLRDANRILRKADYKVSELESPFKGASSWSEVVDNAKDTLKAQSEYVGKANQIINLKYQRDISAFVAKYLVDDPILRGTMDDYVGALSRVLKAENAAGISRSSRAIEVAREKGTMVIDTLDKSTNEFVNALYRKRTAGATIAMLKDSTDLEDIKIVKAAKEELGVLNETIANFRATQPAELVTAAEDLEVKARAFSERIQDLKQREKVLDADTLAGWRASGHWHMNGDTKGEYFGYMRQQRKKDFGYVRKNDDGLELTISDPRAVKSYRWGDTDEWEDISFVLFDDLNSVARDNVRKIMTDNLKDLGFKVEVAVSGEDVQRAEVVKKTKNKALNEIQKNTRRMIKGADSSLYQKGFSREAIGQTIKNTEASVERAGTGVTRAKATSFKNVQAKYARRLFNDTNAVPDEFVEAFVSQKMSKPVSMMDEEEFVKFFEGAPEDTQEIMRDWVRQSNYEAQQTFDAKMGESGMAGYTRSNLPKIKTSDYTRVTGYARKDAPEWLRPFLSEKQGQPLDLIAHESFNLYDEDLDRVLDIYAETAGGMRGNRRLSAENIYDTLHATNEYGRPLSYLDPRDLDRQVNRSLLVNNYNNVWDDYDGEIRDFILDMKKSELVRDAETLYADRVKKLEDLKSTYNIPGLETDLNETFDSMIDDLVDSNMGSKNVVTAFSNLKAGEVEDVVEYATLKELNKKSNLNSVLDQYESAAREEYNKILTARGKADKESIPGLAKSWARESREWLAERIEQRYGQASARIAENNSEFLDQKSYFEKINELNEEIAGAKKAQDVVKTYDAYGREEYVRLSPTIADFITTMPAPLRRSKFGELNQGLARVFRMGTTGGLVPNSLINQAFRDTGNALILGDAWLSTPAAQRVLSSRFGEQLAEELAKEAPDILEYYQKQATETGESLSDVLAKREMARGAANIESELESNLYQFTKNERLAKKNAGIFDKSFYEKTADRADKFAKKTEYLNDMREKGLRNRVYSNNLVKALDSGFSLPQARRFAEFLQSEATTNFGRQVYHLNNLAKTVPYLGSAINGSKSFYRLLAFDPVGVTTRLVGGYVVPMIALTNMSLATEENRRIWKQIPEYEKQNNMVFVVDGQILSLPVPQEISNFLRPIQSSIETMYNANDHSFEELLLNDLVGFLPYNLEGFQNIDADRILSDDLLNGHLLPGVSKLMSQLMPPLQKAGFIAATGVDPYTGKRVETSYVMVDPETGESITMGSNVGELASFLGSIFGGVVSPQMAQKLLETLVGTGNMTLVDSLGAMAASVVKEGDIMPGVTTAAEKYANLLTKPLTVSRYGEQSNLAWNRAVSQLYREKEALQADPEYVKDLQALSKDDLTEEARNKIKSRIATKREEFQQKVLTATQNLMSEYSGTFDKNKYASVLTLMTFTSGTDQTPENVYSSYLSKQEYQAARAAAVETMADMGFTSPNDNSLFGYYKEDGNGNIAFQLNDPITVLNYDLTDRMQDKMALANVRELVTEAGLYDKHEAVNNQIQKIYDSKKKLTNSDYANIEAIQINWNAEVAKTLAPLVKSLGAEAAINNKGVRDYLYTYIEVPGSWEKNNQGKSVSLGDRGSKKAAYYSSWVKSMFNVNDPYKGQY